MPRSAYQTLIINALKDLQQPRNQKGVSRRRIRMYLLENCSEMFNIDRFPVAFRMAMRRLESKGLVKRQKQSFRIARDANTQPKGKPRQSKSKPRKKRAHNKKKGSTKKQARMKCILKQRVEGMEMVYFVKWSGDPAPESTWIKESEMNSSRPGLVRSWKRKYGLLLPSTALHSVSNDKTSSTQSRSSTTRNKKARKKKPKKTNKKKKTGQKTHSKASSSSRVDAVGSRVEDECPLKATHRVLVGPDGDPYTATLNGASRIAENSKFYILQLLCTDSGHWHMWTRWGRVGLSGLSKLHGPIPTKQDAVEMFTLKFYQKTGNQWEQRSNFEPEQGKYTLLGAGNAGDGSYDGMLSRLAANPNDRVEISGHADEKSGNRVSSHRTHSWQYFVDDQVDGKGDGWYNYDEGASDVVDFAFKDWRRNPAVSVRAVRSGVYTYSINFNEMQQTNIEHPNHTQRTIRRVPLRPARLSGSSLSFLTMS